MFLSVSLSRFESDKVRIGDVFVNNCTFSELKTSGEELLYLLNTVAIKICVSEGKFILEIFVTRRIYSYANILLYSSIIEDV